MGDRMLTFLLLMLIIYVIANAPGTGLDQRTRGVVSVVLLVIAIVYLIVSLPFFPLAWRVP